MCFGPCVTLPASSSGGPFYFYMFKPAFSRFHIETTQTCCPGLTLLCSKSNRSCFQVHVPLPLPKQLVIFGLGEWKQSETTISVDVVVSAEVPAQNIGTLSTQARYVEEKC